MRLTNKHDFLQDMHFFRSLDDEDRNYLLSAAIIKNYSKNESLLHQGDSADTFFSVLSGWIKAYKITESGNECVLKLFSKGDIFGEAGIFSDADYPFSAQAVESSRVIEIPSSVILERSKLSPAIIAAIMNSMARKMHHLHLEHEHMSVMNASQRVGCLLLKLSAGMVGQGGTFHFPYDKSLAATQLVMKPETFSRALLHLKSFGVVAKGAEIQIHDFHRLARYCCVNCSAELKDCDAAIRKFSVFDSTGSGRTNSYRQFFQTPHKGGAAESNVF